MDLSKGSCYLCIIVQIPPLPDLQELNTSPPTEILPQKCPPPPSTVFSLVLFSCTTHLFIPLEVRGNGELYFQGGAGNGLQVDRELQLWKQMNVFVDCLAHLGHSDQFPCNKKALLSGQMDNRVTNSSQTEQYSLSAIQAARRCQGKAFALLRLYQDPHQSCSFYQIGRRPPDSGTKHSRGEQRGRHLTLPHLPVSAYLFHYGSSRRAVQTGNSSSQFSSPLLQAVS